jgi:peptidoglycan hydrolase-like protein with peptidoglycan-binding domain
MRSSGQTEKRSESAGASGWTPPRRDASSPPQRTAFAGAGRFAHDFSRIPVLQRKPKAPPVPLKNPLFAGDAQLQAVADGTKILTAGKGPHIFKIQVALMRLGYALPVYGSDSQFGEELAQALEEFQKDEGLTATGSLDAATIAALDKKTPVTALTKYPDYAQLLGDGLLDFTLGVGYDPQSRFDPEVDNEIVPGLKRQFDEKEAADAKKVYAKAGMKMPVHASENDRYFINKKAMLKYGGKNIDVIVCVITYKDPGVREAFLEAMQASDVSLYTGHGRYGSGPDFDPEEKGSGNIFINPRPTVKGRGTAHMYQQLGKQKLDQPLTKIAFDKKYKIWFFDGCNTKHYMLPIRKLAKVDPNTTDVFGWGQEVGVVTTGEDVLSFINGLIAQQSAQQLIDNLNKINDINPKTPHRGAGAEGLGDNPNTK